MKNKIIYLRWQVVDTVTIHLDSVHLTLTIKITEKKTEYQRYFYFYKILCWLIKAKINITELLISSQTQFAKRWTEWLIFVIEKIGVGVLWLLTVGVLLIKTHAYTHTQYIMLLQIQEKIVNHLSHWIMWSDLQNVILWK